MDSQDTPKPDRVGAVNAPDSSAPSEIVPPEHRRRYLERMTMFSDGVAAIALTLLVLPLVDIAAPHGGQSAWQALSESRDELMAFAVTFLVISVLWMAHNRVFSFIADYDSTLKWLNVLYLFAIVALPFPSKWLQYDSFENGVGTIFFGIMFLASLALYLMSRHVRVNPKMLTAEARGNMALVNADTGPFHPIFFGVGIVFVQVLPQFASYYLLALLPLGWINDRITDKQKLRNS